jgi:transcriptional regulator with XRE-family HTH domain
MRIKELFEKSGLKKVDVYNRIGLTKVGFNNILDGVSSPKAENIEKIAKILGVKCGELFDDWEEPQPPTEFHAYIRMDGKDYVANSLEELKQIVNEL